MADFVWWNLFYLIGIYFLGIATSLDLEIDIPDVIIEGDTVTMNCRYNYKKDKEAPVMEWIKDGTLLYRFSPSNSTGTKVFSLSNMNLEVNKSDPQRLLIKNVSQDLTGIYVCFRSSKTSAETNSISLLVLQKDNAVLKVEKTHYPVGKKLRAKCTSPTSLSPLNITWLINDQEITNNKPLTLQMPYKFKTYSSLEYNVVSTEPLKVRCMFSYFSKIHSDVEVVVNENIYDVISSVNDELSEVKSIVQKLNDDQQKLMEKIENIHSHIYSKPRDNI